MLVVTALSSINTRWAGSRKPCSRIQRRRARARSARLRSAPADFFLMVMPWRAKKRDSVSRRRCRSCRSRWCCWRCRDRRASSGADPPGLHHAVGIDAKPGLALRLGLEPRPDVHAGRIEPGKERLLSLFARSMKSSVALRNSSSVYSNFGTTNPGNSGRANSPRSAHFAVGRTNQAHAPLRKGGCYGTSCSAPAV